MVSTFNFGSRIFVIGSVDECKSLGMNDKGVNNGKKLIVAFDNNVCYINEEARKSRLHSALIEHEVAEVIDGNISEAQVTEISEKFANLWEVVVNRMKEHRSLDGRIVYDSDRDIWKCAKRVAKTLTENEKGTYIVARFGKGWELWKEDNIIKARYVRIPACMGSNERWTFYSKFGGEDKKFLRVATVFLEDNWQTREFPLDKLGEEEVVRKLWSIIVGRV